MKQDCFWIPLSNKKKTNILGSIMRSLSEEPLKKGGYCSRGVCFLLIKAPVASRRFTSIILCQDFHLAQDLLTETRTEEAWLPVVTWGWLAFMTKVQDAFEAFPMVTALIKAFYISLPLKFSPYMDFLMSNSRWTNTTILLERTLTSS